MSKKLLFIILLAVSQNSHSQILGGGTNFSNAVTFDQAWLTSCPSGAQTLSNVVGFEPTVALDACAPTPSAACVTGTTGSDVWYKFYAQGTTATIVVAPTSAFNIVLQAFSGSACPGLTDIGCANALGNNGTETLNLTGLTLNQLYYFRIFGVGNNAGARTGPYTFCGSTQLGSTILPVEISSFTGAEQNGKIQLNWITQLESNNAHFEIEKSTDGSYFESIGKVFSKGNSSISTAYSFTDFGTIAPTNYYRLKLLSTNGSIKYSSIVNIKLNEKLKNTIAVSPNPVKDKINISINATNNTLVRIKIINALGKIIYQQEESVMKGSNILSLNTILQLAKGIYTVQVVMNNEILNKKIIVAQ
jgi:Secretion system C-terminal sorting domain